MQSTVLIVASFLTLTTLLACSSSHGQDGGSFGARNANPDGGPENSNG
jgi:hypothetical protein